MRKSIEGSPLPNVPTQRSSPLDAQSRPLPITLTGEETRAERAATSAVGKFQIALGAGAAFSIVAALICAPVAVAPRLPESVKQAQLFVPAVRPPAEVTVRIWSLSPPEALRAVPTDPSARVRLCSSCRWDRASAPIVIRAAGEQIQLEGSADPNLGADGAELSGAWRLEPADGALAESLYRSTIYSSDGHLQVTLSLSMEEYVASVLAAEARGVTSPETLKAMAVATRTYAVRFRGRHRGQSYDFCDSTHCQALRLAGAASRYHEAARATAGELLLYNGKPATTYYHRDCGGTTEAAGIAWREDANAPYLTQQTDPYCTRLGHDTWSAEIPQADLAHALQSAGITPPPGWHGIDVVTRTPSGRARKLRLVGGGNLLIAASALRLAVARALGTDRIRSELFDVRSEADGYVFSGVGAGHGVGLCQNGATEMGTEGKSYEEILAFYYPGTRLSAPPLNQGAVSGN